MLTPTVANPSTPASSVEGCGLSGLDGPYPEYSMTVGHGPGPNRFSSGKRTITESCTPSRTVR